MIKYNRRIETFDRRLRVPWGKVRHKADLADILECYNEASVL